MNTYYIKGYLYGDPYYIKAEISDKIHLGLIEYMLEHGFKNITQMPEEEYHMAEVDRKPGRHFVNKTTMHCLIEEIEHCVKEKDKTKTQRSI